MDEGCYSKGVMNSNVTFGIFPWQGNSWDSRGTKFMMVLNKKLWGVSNFKSQKECLDKLSRKINHYDEEQLVKERVYQSGSFITNEYLATAERRVAEEENHGGDYDDAVLAQSANGLAIKQFKTGPFKGCLWWIEEKMKTCIKNPGMPRSVRQGKSAWAMIVRPHLQVDFVYWDIGDTYKSWSEFSARELLVYHFAHWKRKIDFDGEDGAEGAENGGFVDIKMSELGME